MATILKAFRFALEPTQAQDAALRAWVPGLTFPLELDAVAALVRSRGC